MSWEENVNSIKEIFPGQYQIILDFASNKFLKYLINDDYKYIWVHNHWIDNGTEWGNYDLPIAENKNCVGVIARRITFDFIMPTSDFKNILPFISNGITLFQINHIPPSYLDPRRIVGKTRYDLLLKECDYLFGVDIPAQVDYGTLISPNEDFLKSLLNNTDINWNDLP